MQDTACGHTGSIIWDGYRYSMKRAFIFIQQWKHPRSIDQISSPDDELKVKAADRRTNMAAAWLISPAGQCPPSLWRPRQPNRPEEKGRARAQVCFERKILLADKPTEHGNPPSHGPFTLRVSFQDLGSAQRMPHQLYRHVRRWSWWTTVRARTIFRQPVDRSALANAMHTPLLNFWLHTL